MELNHKKKKQKNKKTKKNERNKEKSCTSFVFVILAKYWNLIP